MAKEQKNYASILTNRARYDRVEYTRVLKDPDRGRATNGYQIVYNKIGDKGKVRVVTEFILDKWIVKMRKYQ